MPRNRQWRSNHTSSALSLRASRWGGRDNRLTVAEEDAVIVDGLIRRFRLKTGTGEGFAGQLFQGFASRGTFRYFFAVTCHTVTIVAK
jgi:hypothetical protein